MILTVPPVVATDIVPGLHAPSEFRAIVNGHFRVDPPLSLAPIIGVVNGTVEWLFAFAGRLSVTISAGDRLLDVPRETWRDAVAGGRDHCRPSQGAAAVADRARAPRHLRCDAGAECPAARRRHRVAQSVSRRRLDRYEIAGDHRRAIRSGNRAAISYGEFEVPISSRQIRLGTSNSRPARVASASFPKFAIDWPE